MEEFIKSFIEEVSELLLQLEEDIINLENDPDNRKLIDNIFRVMHTLKGSAGMVGFKRIQELTHKFEGLYCRIREGSLVVTSDIIDLTLKGKDLISIFLKGKSDEKAYEEIVRQINEYSSPVSSSPGFGFSNQSASYYVVIFSPDKNIYGRGLNPEKVVEELESAGNSHIITHEQGKSRESKKNEKECQTVWEIYLRTSLSDSDVNEIFLFYDPEEYEIFPVMPENLQAGEKLLSIIKNLYTNENNPAVHLKDNLKSLSSKGAGEATSKKKVKSVIESVISDENHTDSDLNISVSSAKLDVLMNLVSELVTLTATAELHASRFNDAKLNNSFENIEKLTKQFRNNALDLRLVPVGSLFAKVKRQIRDLSKELGKKVNLFIDGQDIEIDKSILRSIESPLQHIIRNSIDHGIETETVRLEKGKSPEGILKITAFQSGANVIIQVHDDGSGINLDKVKECAIKNGIIKPDQPVTKQELLNFIVEPGFTTADNISMVSGRGVGMDVVKKELNSVGGSFEIFTEKDLGTSITLKLPTTLTIVDTLMVEVADTQILIPITDIEYCFKDDNKNLFKSDSWYIQYKNNPVPLVSLREKFNYPSFDKEELMVIVINKFDRKFALIADRIVGEHQAVIKPLGDLFANQQLFSGGSIMVDGKLAFILDTNFLYSHEIINN
jgi:two-component system chemotaxis sensor kinase CheA